MGWMQIVRGAVLTKVRALVAADADLTADGWTVHRTRPGSADLPCVWLDGPDLTMTHDAGARSTVVSFLTPPWAAGTEVCTIQHNPW